LFFGKQGLLALLASHASVEEWVRATLEGSPELRAFVALEQSFFVLTRWPPPDGSFL
jgi:hypothetical protein